MDTFDLNTLRIAVTVASFVLFLALMLHSYSRRRVDEHAAAAMLPFADDVPAGAPAAATASARASAQAPTGEQQ